MYQIRISAYIVLESRSKIEAKIQHISIEFFYEIIINDQMNWDAQFIQIN